MFFFLKHLSDSKFLQSYDLSDRNTLFEWDVELKGQINAEQCKFKASQLKLEIKLIKKTQKRWESIFKLNQKQAKQAKEDPVNSKLSTENVNNKPIVKETTKIDASKHITAATVNTTPQNIKTTTTHKCEEKPKIINEPPPLPPKVLRGPYYGYTGLANLGNTCYMNATLQCLANTTDFRDFFFGITSLFA